MSVALLFRIEHTSTAYFRALFGGIAAALRTLPGADVAPGGGRTPERRRFLADEEASQYAPADQALRNLLAPGRAADTAAFAALRAARPAIDSALRAALPPPAGVTLHNSHVVLESTGAAMTENFSFHGQHTTFVNRPQGTVIRDFQNTHGTALGADELTRLLQLVLSSGDLAAADREEAAAALHDLARIGAAPEPDPAAAATRLERLRTLLSSGADIAAPALTLLASLAAFFPG